MFASHRTRVSACGKLAAGALRGAARAPLRGFSVLWSGHPHALVRDGPMRTISAASHGYCACCSSAGVGTGATACHSYRIYVASAPCAGPRGIMTVKVFDGGVPTAECWTHVSFGTTQGTVARCAASQDPGLFTVQLQHDFIVLVGNVLGGGIVFLNGHFYSHMTSPTYLLLRRVPYIWH